MDRIDPQRMKVHHSAAAGAQRLATAAVRRYTHAAAPPLVRGSMAPQPWFGFFAGLRQVLTGAAPATAAPWPARGWVRAAARRRMTLVALVLLSAVGAGSLLLQSQTLAPGAEPSTLHLAQVALFTLLFAWVAAGFVTALMGYFVLRRGDRHMLSHRSVAQQPIAADARTAIVMPICNEHVATVFAGLRATAESLVASGGARLAEIYVLSDTPDPVLRAAERAAWIVLRDRMAGAGLQVHYRWRLRRTRKKAGNVADFCRRWGRKHRYMIVLDADSVMSGEALLGLVRLMEAHPHAGIIQSAPVACGVDTLHARAQQFAARVTGRLFSAGMQYWQLGESHYWGHNAIIRIAPFMAHCALAPIKGRGGLAGDILSHDFVEAALMRRAGWQVWLVADLPGSWEQQPPNLLAELQRDRRWCQGNLQNARLMTEPGLHRVHRAMLATGAMSYLSAPLWLGFVVLGVALWLSGGHALLDLRQGLPVPVLALWAATLGMLLLPRALGAWLVLREDQQHLYGGTLRLVGSSLLEALLSALQAPLRMAAHTLFVLGALTGLKLEWKSPPREATKLAWRDAARPLLPVALLAALALGATLLADASVALWLAPVALPLVLALPLVVWAGRPALGRRLRSAGLLLTPEETAPHRVLRRAWAEAAHPAPATLATAAPPVGEVIALRALPRWAAAGAGAVQAAGRR
jgi:membrane glycosyltransferase